MTKDEVRKLLMVLDAIFTSFNVKDPEDMVDAWHFVLQDYPAEEILLAMKTYISTQGSAYAPSVSELIAMTRKPKELTELSESEAWSQVRKAISRSIYNSREEFEKLPEEAKRVVVRPDQLVEWAMMSSDEVNTVVRSNFRRSYEVMNKRAAEIAALPKEIKNLIGETEKKMIGEKGDVKV